jgi:hypothetical protein
MTYEESLSPGERLIYRKGKHKVFKGMRTKEFWRELFESDKEGTCEIYRTFTNCFPYPDPEELPDPTCAYPGCYKKTTTQVKYCCGECGGRFCEEHIRDAEKGIHGCCDLCQMYESGKGVIKQYSQKQLAWTQLNDFISVLNSWGNKGWRLINIETEEEDEEDSERGSKLSKVLLMRERI